MMRDGAGEMAPGTSHPRRGLPKILAAISGGLALMAAGSWGLEKALVGFPEHPATVEGIERELGEATPAGCSWARVLAWVDSRGLREHCSIDSEQDPTQSARSRGDDGTGASSERPGGTIRVMIHDTSRSLLVRGQIQVEWSFDARDHLARAVVRPINTGL